jgi:Putative adhesin
MNKNHQISSQAIVSSPSILSLASIAVLVVLFASTAAFASTPQGTFEKTLQVNGPVNLEVMTHSGDITIRAGSSGSVFIRGKIYVGDRWFGGRRDDDVHSIETNPPIRQTGNSIHVEYVNMRNISVDYEISVPADTTVTARSGSGDQILEATHGNADVQTGSGNIKLANLTGEVRMQTGSGDVRARSLSGAVRGGTGSGNIEIEETGSGDIELRTGSGNLTARGVHGGFRGETGSGDITAEGTQTGSWDIHTGSGNVHVRLPGSAAFDADISTSSGSVDVGAPVEMTVQGRVDDVHKSIHGKVRGGGPLMRVRTGSGDIHID